MTKVEVYCEKARGHLNEAHFYEYLFSNRYEANEFVINHLLDEQADLETTQHWTKIEFEEVEE